MVLLIKNEEFPSLASVGHGPHNVLVK